MAATKVLIAVKTYPTISSKYDELVCTAGFREDGSWIRIYPVQFRKKPYAQQYKKYQWIELDLVKNEKDFRPESFWPVAHDTEINVLGEIPADGDAWHERRKVVLKNVYTNLEKLITQSKDNLAVFKPSVIRDFLIEPVEREWSKEKLASLQQLSLFATASEEKSEVIRKLPFKFSYRFEDDQGRSSTLMIEDWEIGALFWNEMERHMTKRKQLQASGQNTLTTSPSQKTYTCF